MNSRYNCSRRIIHPLQSKGKEKNQVMKYFLRLALQEIEGILSLVLQISGSVIIILGILLSFVLLSVNVISALSDESGSSLPLLNKLENNSEMNIIIVSELL